MFKCFPRQQQQVSRVEKCSGGCFLQQLFQRRSRNCQSPICQTNIRQLQTKEDSSQDISLRCSVIQWISHQVIFHYFNEYWIKFLWCSKHLLREVVKKQPFYSQADHRGWPLPPLRSGCCDFFRISQTYFDLFFWLSLLIINYWLCNLWKITIKIPKKYQ